ncbi:MAG: hypothetical protein WDZ35_03090 [Crocinitomicaceae bacterium]
MREVVVIGIMIVFFASCGKQPPVQKLPSPTQSGEHTLGFYLNGSPWIPYDRGRHEIFELPKPILTEDGILKISATRIDPANSSRSWFCIETDSCCAEIGRYALSSHLCTSPYQTFYYGQNKDLPSENYEIDRSQPHYMDITSINRSLKIISGSFEFDAISESNQRIEVRSGRFDLNYE